MANNLFFHNVHLQIYDYSTNLKGEIERFSALIERTKAYETNLPWENYK